MLFTIASAAKANSKEGELGQVQVRYGRRLDTQVSVPLYQWQHLLPEDRLSLTNVVIIANSSSGPMRCLLRSRDGGAVYLPPLKFEKEPSQFVVR